MRSPSSLFLLLVPSFALLACSAAPAENVEQGEDALGVSSPEAAEIADAVRAHGAACVDLEGAIVLHKCSSRGNVRPRIRLEVHAFERTDPSSARGAVVVIARGKRVVVPAEISPSDGSGYYWNEDTSFDLDGKRFALSINDPEDYGYTESASGKQMHFGCTPAPEGWGPWN